MLGQLRRTDDVGEDVEYYRLRSFSITPNGIFNLGDSFRSRRSRSINSASSSGSSQSINSTPSHRERVPSTTSQCSTKDGDEPPRVPRFKVAMLGASGVGKTALTCQFTTSEYICAYDTSLDEEFGQKTVSVMLDGREAELEIVDHPSSEMSTAKDGEIGVRSQLGAPRCVYIDVEPRMKSDAKTANVPNSRELAGVDILGDSDLCHPQVESYCATYNPEVFVVVYSVVDRNSFKAAEDILLFLWKSDYISSKGVILVGNKADLERKREVPLAVGRKLANSCNCKFIETSSGLAHNVDELLVGILAQVQLNPRRDREKLNKKTKKQKVRIGSGKRILKHLLVQYKEITQWAPLSFPYSILISLPSGVLWDLSNLAKVGFNPSRNQFREPNKIIGTNNLQSLSSLGQKKPPMRYTGPVTAFTSTSVKDYFRHEYFAIIDTAVAQNLIKNDLIA
uniref:Uncharacterized protein n=1 Tax=Timema douglasi TaxID=61478 RepID=A0A7R8VBJ0_TIMDO|nr:unnamed protein product [Timema douglasi]